MRFPGVARFRWTIRDLMIVGAICSFAAAIGAHYYRHPERFPEVQPLSVWPQGSVEALLTLVGSLLIYSGFRFADGRWHIWIQTALTVVGLGCLWFAAIDFALQHAWCSRCGQRETTVSVRLYRLPLWSHCEEERHHFLSLIAEDLGVRCMHQREPELWIRAWGFLCVYPCVGGTLGLYSGEYADIRPFVMQMAAEDPELPERYYRLAIEQQDQQFIRQFFSEVHRRRTEAVERSNPTPYQP